MAKNLSSAKADMRPLVALYLECAQREFVTVVISSRSVAVSDAEFRPAFVKELFGISPREIGTSQRAAALFWRMYGLVFGLFDSDVSPGCCR